MTAALIRTREALDRLGGVAFLAGAGMAACFAALMPLPDLRGPNVSAFLAYFLLAGTGYVLAVLRLGKGKGIPLGVVWFFAILFRGLLLFTSPTLSDDVFRYAWDGHLLTQGVNPYAHAVNSPQLDAYAVPIRELVNHDWMATPYLPAAQLLFGLVTRLSPSGFISFQIAAVCLDLLAGLLVMDLLRRLRRPAAFALIYLWNPLVVVEFAQSAHLADALMLVLIALAFWALARARENAPRAGAFGGLSALALAGATLTKGLPLLFAPLMAPRWRWRDSPLYAGVVGGALLAFALGAGWGLIGPLDGKGVFGALRIYLEYWNYNSGIYHWLETGLSGFRSPGPVPLEPAYLPAVRTARALTTAALGLAVLAAGWWAFRLGRSGSEDPAGRDLALLRLGALTAGAFLLLTRVVHPWYVTLLALFLPFLAPLRNEAPGWGRFLWPGIYFSLAVALSYLTYSDPSDFREFTLVRNWEYLPLFALLSWAVWPKLIQGLASMLGTGRGRARTNRR